MTRVNNLHGDIDRTASNVSIPMPDTLYHARSITLSLPPEEQWTLHHVLLDRIEQETTAAEPANVSPPPVEVFQAFETLDAGETRFTIAQPDAMQTILAEYHHSTTWWEIERAQLEQLLHRITEGIKQHHAGLPTTERHVGESPD